MRGVVACWVLVLVFSVPVLASDPALETRTFALAHVDSRDALTLLRAILDMSQLEFVDDDTITATATPDRLQMSAQLLALVDVPGTVDQVHTLADGDELTIAVVPLRGASSRDALAALRELRIRRIAIASVQDIVVVSDSEPQVKTALERLERLRRSQAK